MGPKSTVKVTKEWPQKKLRTWKIQWQKWKTKTRLDVDPTRKKNGNMVDSFEKSLKIEKLTNSESYQIWKIQIVILFKSHDLWERVMVFKKLETIIDKLMK